jgi:hypothetical protein
MINCFARLEKKNGDSHEIWFTADDRAEALSVTFIGAFVEVGFRLVEYREDGQDVMCYPLELGGGVMSDELPLIVDGERVTS